MWTKLKTLGLDVCTSQGKKKPLTLKIRKRPQLINSRAKVQKRRCRIKRNVFQAIKPRATFFFNSVRGKGHSPQSKKLCGLKRTEEIIVTYGQGFSRFLVLDQLNTATTAQVPSMRD